MSAKSSVPKENAVVKGEKKSRTQLEAGTLWTNQDEMKKYISKLKSELTEQRNKVRRVNQDKADEIKRLHENLDNEKQKAIENVAKKLESDKAYEMKKLRDTVSRQKEAELREILRVKDEEMRALRHELQDTKNSSRMVELENKRILSDRLKGDASDFNQRLRNEIGALKQDKKKLEESLRIKTDSDFAKAEEIRKMRSGYDAELQRLTRDSKRASFKEFRHLKAVSKQIEAKNHELATKEAELHRVELEKDSLGNELTLRRNKKTEDEHVNKINSSFKAKKTVPELNTVADEKIRRLKMRNSELVAIARKLEEKAKRLQEEKDILEKSNGSSPELGNLKKAFARQRAKDLAEHAKVLMKKDSVIDNLKKEAQGSSNALNKIDNVDELKKIVEQTAKERLLLEKQLLSKEQILSEEIKELREKNLKMLNNNEMLKEELAKLQDIEAKHYEMMFEMDQICQEHKALQQNSLEKDERISKMELEKQIVLDKNVVLQQENNELSCKVQQLKKLEEEYKMLKENLQYLKNENELLTNENNKLLAQIENLSMLKKEVEKLQGENRTLHEEKDDSVLKLEERERDVTSLRKAQTEAQHKHEDEVSGLEQMIERLQTQSASTPVKNGAETTVASQYMLNSTPKDSKCTQTSRASSPALSPIEDRRSDNMKEEADVNDLSENENYDTLCVPAENENDGSNSSASFDLEKAANRIEQLAASDSDVDNDAQNGRSGTESLFSSELSSSDNGDEDGDKGSVASEDTSYSADVSQTTDHEEEEPDQPKPTTFDDPDSEDVGIFIGSPSPDPLDIDEKLSIFIAKYSYDPMLYSPNENPDVELAFQAGDYLYVYGDVDEDGFFVGELMNGERGLVPSNFIERIAEEDEAILKGNNKKGDDDDDDDDDDDGGSEDESSEEEITLKDEDGKRKVIRPKAFSERRHEMFRTSLDHVLNDQLGDIRESEEEELSFSSASDDWVKQRRSDRTEVDQNISDGLVSTESEEIPQRVFSPTKLSLDRQFTSSALISWEAAEQHPDEEIQGYNVYVNGKFKTHVKGNNKTNVLVEDVYPNETYRISVRTKSVHGTESPENEATIVFGPDANLSPYDLKVTNISETSAKLTWTPANSCYGYAIFLDESLLLNLKPSISSYTLSDLTPSTQYHVQVRTEVANEIKLKLGQSDSANCTSEVEFTTSVGGLPEPPVDLRVEKQTTECIIFTWLPVTISHAGYSNGFTVTNYKIYVNGVYCVETESPDVDTATVSKERLAELGKRHDLTRMRFVARTQSVLGESVDSNVVEVASLEPDESPSLGHETAVQSDLDPVASLAVIDEGCAHVADSSEDKVSILSEGDTIDSEDVSAYPKPDPKLDSNAGAVEATSQLETGSDTGNESAADSSGGNRTEVTLSTEGLGASVEPVVAQYNVEETESESCTTESVTETEEEVIEVFPPSSKVEENDLQRDLIHEEEPLLIMPEEGETPSADESGAANIQLDKPSSESETETDFEEVLSVIHEVDEDNLTGTASESVTAQESKNEEGSTLSEDQLNADTSKSSESKTKTISSEDDGFRTEDDVLDLLDDDDAAIGATKTNVATTKADESSELSANETLEEDEEDNEQYKDELTQNVGQDIATNNTLPKSEEAKEQTLSVGSSDNLSEASIPTGTSLNSDSLSSISDVPPPPDEAEDTILNTLSLPDGPGPGANDLNDSAHIIETGSREWLSDSGRSESEPAEIMSESVRYFVSLYEYDPTLMSPNDDGADEELAFREGDVIKVFGEKDADGFFWGECKRKQGYVPSNMVTEITVEEAEDMYNETNVDSLSLDRAPTTNGHCEIDVDMVTTDLSQSFPSEEPVRNRLSFWDLNETAEFGARKMRAKFDYDPEQDSPNVDREVELLFQTGDVIYVFGDMDDDGFFQGELHGIRGLVPSNFLELVQDSDDKDTTTLISSPPSTSSSTEHLQEQLQENSRTPKMANGTTKAEGQPKKKKGLFSKGKKIFKKAFR